MNKKIFVLSVLLAALALVPSATAKTVDLLQPSSTDLVAGRLTAPHASKALPTVSTDAVTFSWALPADQPIENRPEPFHASSREYSLVVTAVEFQKGVELPLTAPGALIRINPSGTGLGAATVDPQALVLTDPNGIDHTGGAGMLTLADAAAMKASGAPFAEGTSAFRIDPALGSGRFTLRSASIIGDPADRYAVHVFEKDSAITLDAVTDRSAYLVGDAFQASFELIGDNVVIDQIDGRLVAPSGEAVPVRILDEKGARFLTVAPLENARGAEGLWEVHASIVGHDSNGEIRRDVHTAFAVAVPTARLLGRAEITRDGGLEIELPVETAAPGRYEVRGILFGTDADGVLRPIGVGDAADWMPQGIGSLSLHFDAKMLEGSGLHAPFELRDLQLLDQGRMGELHRQAIALHIR